MPGQAAGLEADAPTKVAALRSLFSPKLQQAPRDNVYPAMATVSPGPDREGMAHQHQAAARWPFTVLPHNNRHDPFIEDALAALQDSGFLPAQTGAGKQPCLTLRQSI